MAKQSGQPVTCEVCPHHLLLTQEELPEGVREVEQFFQTIKMSKN
jgi:dihydroorotase-like cyclic amidohydrolase